MRRLATITAGLTALALMLAGPASATVMELGVPADSPFPPAGCPQNCSAIGRVTGYQTQIGRHGNPYGGAKVAGKVVAFTVELGNPSASQTQFFVSTFGGQPEVRLAVMKSLSRHRGLQLLSQSELINVGPYLGTTPSFVLQTPLSVPAHAVLALTVPTWVPSFATKSLGSDQQWRSSRTTCGDNTQFALQQAVGSVRKYNCLYKGARLLFSATFVPTPIAAGSTSGHPSSKPHHTKHH